MLDFGMTARARPEEPMDGDRHTERVAAESALLTDAVRRGFGAMVRRYPSWTVADLGRHVGEVHRWVIGILETHANERPPRPDVSGVSDPEVPSWLGEGAHRLVRLLADTAPTDPVWTFGAGQQTAAFWRRRMAIETTLHRWDAEDAIGAPGPVPEWLAAEAVEEALRIYLVERLDGAEVGGADERLLLDCGEGRRWVLTFHDRAVDVAPGGSAADATFRASPLEAWLFLTGRRRHDEVDVEGDRRVLELCARTAAMVPGPA
jgi:uncharacterized protein (TIGR03083 family)